MDKNNQYSILIDKLNRIEQLTLLSAKNILNVEDVCALTGLSKSRIYALCSTKEIPHYKQGQLYFKRSELEAWMTANRQPTRAEIQSQAQVHCLDH